MEKEGYKPTSGMQSAAHRAIKLKEQGKANGAGTMVGWTRAGQLSRGEALSLSTVKRMYSFFSRHEVDKQGKDWNNSENPSNGKIMWLAWGGDAGFSWSRKIVEREKNMKKSSEIIEIVEEIKDILDNAVNPIAKVVEIEDDLEIAKAYGNCDCAKCMDKDMTCDNCPDCTTKSYVSEDEDMDKWDNVAKSCWAGYEQLGMKDKNGKQVPNCVPIKKMEDEAVLSDSEKAISNQGLVKSFWGESLDPVAFAKRKFNTKERERAAASGNAMPDGSYPINNKEDLHNAIMSWGRGGADPKVKSHIKRRAKELGQESMIPDNWK